MAAAASSRSFAKACVLAVLLVGCLAAADARRLLITAMPPMAADMVDMSPAQAPAPESGADLAGRMLFEGRSLLDGGLRIAGRLLIGLGL